MLLIAAIIYRILDTETGLEAPLNVGTNVNLSWGPSEVAILREHSLCFPFPFIP